LLEIIAGSLRYKRSQRRQPWRRRLALDLHLRQLRREIFARIDELVPLEFVLLVLASRNARSSSD
jgi:hypothetical protein